MFGKLQNHVWVRHLGVPFWYTNMTARRGLQVEEQILPPMTSVFFGINALKIILNFELHICVISVTFPITLN